MDLAERCWHNPYWLDALAEIDRDPPPAETPELTYKRRLVAITVMCDIEKAILRDEEEANARRYL